LSVCRLVCNTWGLAGVEPVAKRDVGYLSNTRLLLYNSKSLESVDAVTDEQA
jgi:hypothetical protein